MAKAEQDDTRGSTAAPADDAGSRSDDAGNRSYRLLSVIVPVFNERVTVAEIIRRIRAVDVPVDVEIIVVDDGSSDGTDKVLTALGDSTVRVLTHPVNQGKGAAIRTGMAAARGDLLLVQDADPGRLHRAPSVRRDEGHDGTGRPGGRRPRPAHEPSWTSRDSSLRGSRRSWGRRSGRSRPRSSIRRNAGDGSGH